MVFNHAKSQTTSFSHITTSDGLSENNIRSVAIDKNRFLWLGTIDGLNLYDGYSVTIFRKETQPEMASNNVIHMTCDSRNRIWLGMYEGVTMIDENRKFHRIALNDTVTKFGCRTIMDTKAYGPVLYTSLGQFFFNEKTQKWEKLTWVSDKLAYPKFHDAEPFDENTIIYATDSLVILVDYAQKKIVYEQPFTSVFSMCRYNENQLAIGIYNEVKIVDIRTKEIVRKYSITSELNKKIINANVTEVRPAINGSILVATQFGGIVVIDKDGNMTRHMHDPVNPYSLGANITWRVLCGDNGDVVVGTSNAGASIFNIYNKQTAYKRIFSDGQGNYYDSYVTKMVEDKDGVIWVGALDRLIKWDKENNKTKFYYYDSRPVAIGSQNFEIRTFCFDKQNRIWAGVLGDGVSILNQQTGEFKKIPVDTSLGPAVKSKTIIDVISGSDGLIWVATAAGMYTINPTTLKVNVFTNHPRLKEIKGRVNTFLESRAGNLWIGTNNGLYSYNRQTDSLSHFTPKEGLAHIQSHVLFEDSRGRIYTGTLNGFSIIYNGKVQESYNRDNGLKMGYVEGIAEDKAGKIWLANSKFVICFDPEKKTMQYFGQNSGFTNEGFRIGSFLQSRKGELFFGSRSGLNHFYPDLLINHPADIKVSVYQTETPDSIYNLGTTDNIKLGYRSNSVIYRFSAVNLLGSKNIQYKYKLEGYDKDWETGVDIRQVRYSSLPPGNYVFKLMASTDGINWISPGKDIATQIIPPIWQRWWFIAAILSLVSAIIYLLFQNRNQMIRRQKEQLETEQAINYFASSLSEQQTEENILWDVARNCIGRLQFEDCVIYIKDEERDVWVQRAAHGPKSPRRFIINQPIEIKSGQGIVGTVAMTGKAEIITDTTKDSRYIVDDERRLSEISVPIVYDGKVIGVIDCEHSKKGFFTKKHLSILTTIASLCANKIVRVRAEDEKKEAQAILMNTQQKMTEVEMQALRAQMNPHFIFNCLNSINRYIVKSDQATASLYLTKFAKLIRLILDNSNTKNVILTNELEALKLYIEMEALRFDKKFTYSIQVEGLLGTDTVEVPPLIIQPYVENAIWHGLLHKETNGHLSIRISMTSESMLQCIIEDNGVGRMKAKELKSKTATSRKSLGMQLTENRLSLLNKHAELNASVEIIDLQNGHEQAAGTKVILKIPV